MGADWKTPERLRVLLEMHARGANGPEVHRAISAMKGPPVPANVVNVRHWAGQHGLHFKWRHPLQSIGARSQARGVAAARERAAAAAPPRLVVEWGEALQWAAGVDPDMVLRGDRAHRLEQINELRRIFRKPEFELAAEMVAA